jgi:hypothetical protein
MTLTTSHHSIDGATIASTEEYAVTYCADPIGSNEVRGFSFHYSVDLVIGELHNSKSVPLSTAIQSACFCKTSTNSLLILATNCSYRPKRGSNILTFTLPDIREHFDRPLFLNAISSFEQDLLSENQLFVLFADHVLTLRTFRDFSEASSDRFRPVTNVFAFTQISPNSVVYHTLLFFSVDFGPLPENSFVLSLQLLVPVTSTGILVCGLNDARQSVCPFVDFAGGPVCDTVLLDGLKPHGSACFAARDRERNLFYFGSTDSPVVLAGRFDSAGKLFPIGTEKVADISTRGAKP